MGAIEKTVVTMTAAIMMLAIMAQVVQASQPTQYCCAICAQLGTPQCFSTYALLESHFTVAHPTEPIDIVWS